MDIVTLPFRLPFLPLKGLVRLAEVIRDEAEREASDPSVARRQLEQAEEARETGRLPAGEAERREREAVGRLLKGER